MCAKRFKVPFDPIAYCMCIGLLDCTCWLTCHQQAYMIHHMTVQNPLSFHFTFHWFVHKTSHFIDYDHPQHHVDEYSPRTNHQSKRFLNIAHLGPPINEGSPKRMVYAGKSEHQVDDD